VVQSSLFEVEGMRRNVRGRDLLPHRGGGPGGRGLVWFLFEFQGLCGEQLVEGGPDAVSGPCSALELLLVEPDTSPRQPQQPQWGSNGCGGGVCVRQGSALWGNAFPGHGLSGGVLAAAWGPGTGNSAEEEGVLYLLAPSSSSGGGGARLGRYTIAFYDASVLTSSRAIDEVRWMGLTFHFGWDTGGGVPAAPSHPLFTQATVGGLGVAMDALYVGLLPPTTTTTTLPVPPLWRMLCPGMIDACVAVPVGDGSIEVAAPPLLSALLAGGGGVAQIGPVIGEGLLFLQTADGALYALELLNRILAPGLRRASRYGGRTNRWAARWASRTEVLLVGLDGDALLVQPGAGLCPLDTVARYVEATDPLAASTLDWPPPLPYLQMQGCAPLACLRARPCGSNSLRGLGEAACGCEAGYARATIAAAVGEQAGGETVGCLPCDKAASASPLLLPLLLPRPETTSFFCVGGGAPPQRCQPHSATAASSAAASPTAPTMIVMMSGAASRADCLCDAGYFLFQDTCIRCPVSLWCPFNGTVAPVACHGGGLTWYDGASSPVDCVCPPRTYGLRCTPCTNAMECTRSMQATVTSIALRGWGPVGGGGIVEACLLSVLGDADRFLMYSVLGVSRSAEMEPLLLLQGQPSSTLAWSWIVLVRDFNPEMVMAGVEACAGGYFGGLRLEALTRPATRRIQVGSSCGGRHWEWNGDLYAEGCICVAGYEEINTVLFGRHCIPCPNGTFRARYDAGRCTPCRPELFEVGAYLGQSECACQQGYARDPRTWSCQPLEAEGLGGGRQPRIGPMLAEHLSTVLLACIGASAAAFMFSLALVCAL
jgi:hypothetical protein